MKIQNLESDPEEVDDDDEEADLEEDLKPVSGGNGSEGRDHHNVINSAASVPNLNNGKSPHNKRRGLSETPEIQRKSRKLFAARTRDVDKLDSDHQKALRKRSLTNPR